jgi:hypothetical protein
MLSDVRYWMNSRRHLLAKSISGFDPIRTFARTKSRSAATSCGLRPLIAARVKAPLRRSCADKPALRFLPIVADIVGSLAAQFRGLKLSSEAAQKRPLFPCRQGADKPYTLRILAGLTD